MRTLAPLALILAATTADAACFADYKARRDAPYGLHYGVARIDGPCDSGAAARELAPRLAAAGWTLLSIVSTFGPEGLEERRENAGDDYLRY
ncbi:MAG: hypothetical protein ACU0CO_15405 [Shimia sp.]